MVSPSDLTSFQKNGYLIVRDFLTPSELTNLQKWAQEVHDWPPTRDAAYMPYEEVNADGKRVLCRTENYADSHAGFDALLRGQKLLGLLEELAGERMLLFKEKINYKLAGSGMRQPLYVRLDGVGSNAESPTPEAYVTKADCQVRKVALRHTLTL
jgi:2-aminoethylphosphonate dioxygenase